MGKMAKIKLRERTLIRFYMVHARNYTRELCDYVSENDHFIVTEFKTRDFLKRDVCCLVNLLSSLPNAIIGLPNSPKVRGYLATFYYCP